VAVQPTRGGDVVTPTRARRHPFLFNTGDHKGRPCDGYSNVPSV